MMTKYWKIAATQDSKPVTLFTVTSDRQIASDLKLPSGRSLIDYVRLPYSRPSSDEQNHADLAHGAFLNCGCAKVASGTPLELAEAVPDCDPTTFLGGDKITGFLMSIWVQPRA